MPLPAEVSLADVIRSFLCLNPRDETTRRAVAGLLGFDWPTETPESVGGKDPPAPLPDPDMTPPDVDPGIDQPPSSVPAPVTDPATPLHQLQPLSPGASPVGPPLWAGIDALTPFRCATHLKGVARHDPLLHPQWSWAILAGGLATPAADGPVDVEKLIEVVARGRPVDRIPRRPVPSLRRGVQVLVDVGEAMQPFARDQRALVDEVRRVVGPELVIRLDFHGCPSRGRGWALPGAGGITSHPPPRPRSSSSATWGPAALGITRGVRGRANGSPSPGAWRYSSAPWSLSSPSPHTAGPGTSATRSR